MTLASAVVFLLATTSQAGTSAWSEMTAPAAAFSGTGIPDSADPGSAVLTLIRLLHANPDGDDALRERQSVERALADGLSDAVKLPLPLPADLFRTLLAGESPDDDLFRALIRDRRVALFYYGVMAMDAETRAFLAGDPALVRTLAREHASVVAAFGRSVRVQANRVVVPGGDAAVPLWEDLVGARITDVREFIRRLLSARGGRTAYMFDAVAHMDRPRQLFALGLGTRAARDRVRALHHAFTDVDSEWSLDASPFARPMYDAPLVIRLVPVSDAGVPARGLWLEIWKAAFDGDDLPGDPARAFRRVTRGSLIDAGWLAQSIALAPMPLRERRYDLFAFGARLFGNVDAVAASDAAFALRGFVRYPALMLALERMGVRTPAVFVAAVRSAEALSRIEGNGRAATALAQFQSALAILDRAGRAGRLTAADIEGLVLSLCAVRLERSRYDGRLSAWIETALLPALGGVSDRREASPETIVLTGMADRSPDADGRRFEWEGLTYVIDYSAGDLARFDQVRGKQGSHRLDDVLGIAAAVRSAAAESKSLKELPAADGPLASRVRALAPLRDWIDLPGSAPDIDGDTLGDIVDHALAEALLGIVYAPHQGDPSELFTAAADLFHRHDFGFASVGVADVARRRIAWARPRMQDVAGQRMRVSGAVLGIDLALARFVLRRLAADRMPERPRLNQSDREVLVASAALLNPRLLSDSALKRIAASIRRGRARVGEARGDEAALDAVARDAGISAVRRQLLSWRIAQSQGPVEDLFSLSELLRASGHAPDDAWGIAAEPLTGCFCLRFPDETPWEDFSGRAGAGQIAARVPDLVLRLIELFDEIAAPAALLPGALAYATQDFIDEAPSLHTDDWWALVGWARALDRVQVEDYLAGVAARGPLRPELKR
jgi:hypothetical protein